MAKVIPFLKGQALDASASFVVCLAQRGDEVGKPDRKCHGKFCLNIKIVDIS